MDFKQVLERLLDEFEAANVRYALVGGVALGFLGYARATFDIDFLLHSSDLDKTDRILAKLGYKKIFASENVAQYEHSQIASGRVDFILASRPVSWRMLEQATKISIGAARKARVARVEDVIGLKVQSIANDSKRKKADLVDIEALLSVHGKKADWQGLSEYFILFGMKNLYDELKGRFGA